MRARSHFAEVCCYACLERLPSTACPLCKQETDGFGDVASNAATFVLSAGGTRSGRTEASHPGPSSGARPGPTAVGAREEELEAEVRRASFGRDASKDA